MKFRTLSVAAVCLLFPFAAAHAASHSEMVPVAQGVRLHVLEAGHASTRPTLLLIPGWRLTASIWARQLDSLGQDWHVIAVDPRSQGDSTMTGDGDTPEQRARDYHALIAAMHTGPVVLVGWSQGVQDVAAYVDRFGVQDVKGIVLVDSTISKGAADIPNRLDFTVQQLKLLPLLSAAPRDFTAGMMHAIISRPLPEAEFAAIVDQGMKTPPAISQAMLVADMFGVDRTRAIAKFKIPTLVIASSRSAELDAEKALAAALPDARIEIVENAAHAVFVDQPAQFDTLLKAFLKGL
ncbi:MAG TPA: alpha/beta hydrolase [Allosphingosinicella sp.]|jgi:microsomal epoxide hydrolase